MQWLKLETEREKEKSRWKSQNPANSEHLNTFLNPVVNHKQPTAKEQQQKKRHKVYLKGIKTLLEFFMNVLLRAAQMLISLTARERVRFVEAKTIFRFRPPTSPSLLDNTTELRFSARFSLLPRNTVFSRYSARETRAPFSLFVLCRHTVGVREWWFKWFEVIRKSFAESMSLLFI